MFRILNEANRCFEQLLESTEIVTLDGDVGKINKKADEFKNQHESLQRNIEMFLPLVMDCIVSVYRKIKTSNAPDSARQAVRLPPYSSTF